MLDYLFDELGAAPRDDPVRRRQPAGAARFPSGSGFTREGVMREGEWVNDRWVDLVVWGMLEQDWRARRTAG